MVPEERTGGDEGIDQRRTQFYSFYLSRLGHHGRRLRLFGSDTSVYITVMKGAKRDAEREIKMPVYSATYSGKGVSYKTTARSAEQRRNDAAQYDRELRRKLDRCGDHRVVEAKNRKTKMGRKRKVGTKRAKEVFERLCQKGTSTQAMRVLEDQRVEHEVRRHKQIKSGRRFVAAM